jgi:type II secretory pathway pseudopilin PulG
VTARDRIVLVVLAAAALVAGFWFMALTPKRDEIGKLDGQISSEQQRLNTVRASLAQGQEAKDRYDADYAAVARLGNAVPADDHVPSLIAQLQSAAEGSHVDFRTLKVSSGGTAAAAPTSGVGAVAATGAQVNGTDPKGGATATQAAAATLPPGAVVGAAGFPTMPFSFGFEGSFTSMRRFLSNVQRFVRVHGDAIVVDGRLMTIDGFALSAGRDGLPQVKGSLTATTYLLPADQGLAGGATSTGPATAPSAPAGASGGAAAATTTATVTGVK